MAAMITMLRMLTFSKLYYRAVQQKENLLNPIEEYLADGRNVNKAPLVKMRYVHDIFKSSSGSMLDIGCGDGYFMRSFDWLFEKMIGLDIYSINDFTKGKFRKNKDLYTKNGRIEYIQDFFEDHRFNVQFDFVNAGDIIEHVLEVHTFLDKLYLAMRQKGSFCITTPNNVGRSQRSHNRQFDYNTLHSLLKEYFSNFRIDILETPRGSWDFLIAYGTKS